MSDDIPLELQEEIIKRVPVKTLLQLRSVSKEWKSIIDSPNFADDYCVLQSQPRLLIMYLEYQQQFYGTTLPKYKYVLVADDDTLHQHQFSGSTLPEFSVDNTMILIRVGFSQGLVCFYCSESLMAVLWNPWIRKSVDVPVPNVLLDPYRTILGFGVSPQIKDPKIVKVTSFYSSKSVTSVPIPCRVEVFTLSSGTWRTPSCSGNNLPSRNSINFNWDQVVLDGVIYWLAFEWIKVDGRFRHHNLIMSFDLISEGFQDVCLPDNLACCDNLDLSISKRMESVVVLERDETGTSNSVWMMGLGVTKSFTKLFNIMIYYSTFCTVPGFMKNGEPLIDNDSRALVSYDPRSKRHEELEIVGDSFTFSVYSYMETLLLIDQ